MSAGNVCNTAVAINSHFHFLFRKKHLFFLKFVSMKDHDFFKEEIEKTLNNHNRLLCSNFNTSTLIYSKCYFVQLIIVRGQEMPHKMFKVHYKKEIKGRYITQKIHQKYLKTIICKINIQILCWEILITHIQFLICIQFCLS